MTNSFKVTMKKVDISPAAAFFLYENEGSEINEIRKWISDVAFPKIKSEIGEDRFSKWMPHIPNIIHTTFARFKHQVTPERSKKIFEESKKIFATWQPQEILVTDLHLAVEYIPYMHIPKNESSIGFHIQLS